MQRKSKNQTSELQDFIYSSECIIIKHFKHCPALCRWSSTSQATPSPTRCRCHHVIRAMCTSQWHSCSCCIWCTWWSAGTAQRARSSAARCTSQVLWRQYGSCVRLSPLSGGKHSAITMCAVSDKLCIHNMEVTHTQPHTCIMSVSTHTLQAPASCLLTVVCETSHVTSHWRVDPSQKYGSAKVRVSRLSGYVWLAVSPLWVWMFTVFPVWGVK